MSREYVRVYQDVVDDEKFAGMDLQAFGGWLRLLMIADAAWPASAFLPGPAVVPDDVVDDLASRAIVDLLPGHRFRIHGLDRERETRKTASSKASEARWMRAQSPSDAAAFSSRMRAHSAPDAGASNSQMRAHSAAVSDRIQQPDAAAFSTRMPSKAKQSKEEPSNRAREGLVNLEEVATTAWEQATGRTILGSENWAASYIDDAIRRHGPEKVAAAIVTARSQFDHIPEPAALAAAVRHLLDPLPDARQSAAAEEEADREKDQAARDRANRRNLLRARHNSGHHVEASDPECPLCREGNP